MAEDEIDITDLYAVRKSEDRSFVMILELAVPMGVNALKLQTEVEALGESIGLSAALQHENIFIATNDARPVQLSKLVAPHLEPDCVVARFPLLEYRLQPAYF